LTYLFFFLLKSWYIKVAKIILLFFHFHIIYNIHYVFRLEFQIFRVHLIIYIRKHWNVFRIFLYSLIFWNCLSRDLIKSIITFQIYEKRMFSFFFDKFIKSFIHNNNVMRREDKKLEFRPYIASIRKRLPVRWTLPPDGNDDDADYYPALILILLWIVSINLYLRSSLFMDSYLYYLISGLMQEK
jgi:hypothetical protein